MDNEKIERLIERWKGFAARQENDRFVVNSDSERVRLLATGVLTNEENKGFKYCPCRMISGNKQDDARLICPCNFKSQKSWREKGECWCSLFVSDKKV